MENKTNFLDEIIKNVPLEEVEGTFKKDIVRNKILYKMVYHHLTVGESLFKIKKLYGEIGVLMVMKILSDNNIPIPDGIMEEIYSDEYIEQIKKDSIKAGIFGTLFLIAIIFLVISEILSFFQ